MEAVVEQLDVKRALFEKVEAVRRPGTIVSSNTSGIPIASLAEGRSADFRRHLLGTHFFNPPRYLRLVEIIPTADTDPAVVERVSQFCDHRLGKGVVVAKDSPNFIGNHLALYGVMLTLKALESGKYTIEEIDAMTGPALGRPKSATFRTMDIAGVDILAHVATNLGFELPAFVGKMIAKGLVGEKAGQGFYKRVPSTGSGQARAASEILTLDPQTLEYRPKQPAKIASIEAGKSIDDTAQRIKALYNAKDKAGDFLRETLGPTLEYTAKVAPEIAYSTDDVDRVMRWGFGWELGPFAIMKAIGMDTGSSAKDTKAAADSGLMILKAAKDAKKVVRSNAGASLFDLGDGVLALEFHSKMNALGGDQIEMMHAGVKEAAANFTALVVGNDAPNFSAGANLMLLLLEAQEGNWDEIDMMIRAFQASTQALRFADVPVIVAPAGLTLGGGCEITLHGDRVQAAAESYIGLVEVGVGLIPGGGGTKEMLARAVDGLHANHPDLLPFVQRVFETIGFAKVSTSAADARRLGFLGDADRITMNRERLDGRRQGLRARARARRLSAAIAADRDSGRRGDVLAALKLGVHLGVARRPDQRSRRGRRPRAGQRARRRPAAAPDDGERTVPARSRA